MPDGVVSTPACYVCYERNSYPSRLLYIALVRDLSAARDPGLVRVDELLERDLRLVVARHWEGRLGSRREVGKVVAARDVSIMHGGVAKLPKLTAICSVFWGRGGKVAGTGSRMNCAGISSAR